MARRVTVGLVATFLILGLASTYYARAQARSNPAPTIPPPSPGLDVVPPPVLKAPVSVGDTAPVSSVGVIPASSEAGKTAVEAPRPVPSAPVKEPNIDDLLQRLETIKGQKAALEKAEKDTVALLKEKLEQQKERLHKLGVPTADAVVYPSN